MDKFASAILYLIVIISTLLFINKAEHYYRKKHIGKKLNTGFICLIFAVLVPSILAGIRSDTVGTDILVYGKKTMEEAIASSSFAMMNRIDTTYTEYGYRLFVFLISRIFKNTGWLLFFTELVTMVFVIKSAYIIREKISMTKVVAIYLFLFYHTSFNIMRQSIAMSMLLLAFCYLTEKKYVKYALITLLALSIHSFSIIMSVIILALYVLEFIYRRRWQKVLAICLICLLTLSIQYMIPLISGFLGGGLERYVRYMQEENNNASIWIVLLSASFLIKVFLFITTTMILRKNNALATDTDTLFLVTFIGVLMTLFQVYIGMAYRVGEYLGFFLCIYIPRIFNYRIKIKKEQAVYIFYGLLFGFWVIDCMLSGHSSTAVFQTRLW